MTQSAGVRCRNCLTWVEAKSRRRRCPACGEALDTLPLPDLPRRADTSSDLQEPDFPSEARPSDTAPLSEFLAAGSVVLGMVMLMAGAAMGQPLVMMAGFFVMLVVTAAFSIFGKNSSLRRAAVSSANWLIPRWSAPPDRERDRD
jgi:hypothetical protein